MLWLPRDQVTFSITWRLFRSTKVGVLVSGPMELIPDTEMLPNRVSGTKNRLGSKVGFSRLSVASKAPFHASLATFSRRGEMIHLCSPTTDCVRVRVSVVHKGIAAS